MRCQPTQPRASSPHARGKPVDSDTWPSTEDQQDRLMVRLCEVAREALRRREPDPVRLDQIVDAALDRLLEARDVDPPEHPAAWFWTVVFQLRSSHAVPQRRTADLTWEPEAPAQDALLTTRKAWLREHLQQIMCCLSSRQAAILGACMTNTLMAAAARAVGESPRDFRRAVRAVGKKIGSTFLADLSPGLPSIGVE